MEGRIRLLFIESLEEECLRLASGLEQQGLVTECRRVDTFPGLVEAVTGAQWDAVITGYHLPGMDFRTILGYLSGQVPQLPVILVAASIGEELAIDLLRNGLWDFVSRDRPGRLAEALGRSLDEARSRQDLASAAAALRVSEARYRSLFEHMLTGYARCRMIFQGEEPVDFTFLEVNEAFTRLTGLNDVVGQPVTEVIPRIRASNQDLFECCGRVARTGVPEPLETFVPALGIWFSLSVYAQAPGEFAAVFANITQRKRDEAELRETSQRLAQATLAGGFGVWEWDLLFDSVICDDRMREIYGLQPGEATGGLTWWKARVHPEDVRGAIDCMVRTIISGREFALEFRLVLADGRIRPIKSFGTVLRDEGGRAVRIVGLQQDISTQWEAEEQRRRLEVELRHAERLESLGGLASGVAHDMNNVLAAIMAVAEVLRQRLGAGDPSLLEALDNIMRAGNRGRNLVKGLTNFARKDLRGAEPVDLNRVVREEADLLEHTLRQKIQLRVELEPGLPWVLGEASGLSGALMNLCMNSVDAMAGGGTLTLRTRRIDGGRVELQVEDTGEGMSAEVRARALEPFFTTKPVGQGTGLGLAMVHGMVNSHSDTLDLQTEPGRGTRISLRLPAMADPVPDDSSATAQDEHGPRSLRVLLVDDDELIRATIPALLATLGHETVAVPSGEKALEELAAGLQVDLVLLDQNMPGLSGTDTFLQLRPRCPDLPVVMASGYLEPAAQRLVQEDPRADSLGKPYLLEELNQKLQAFF